jgi:hypothetical protein
VGTLDAKELNNFKNWLGHEPRMLGKSKAENRYKLMQVFTIEDMLTLAEDLVRRCLVVDLVPSSKKTEEVKKRTQFRLFLFRPDLFKMRS